MDNSTKKKEGIFGDNHKTSELYDIKLGNVRKRNGNI